MACVAAERGPEPPAFQRRTEASAPRLAHGYGLRSLSELRDLEFGRLAGTVYLDHAGATLFPQSQLTNFTKDLMENVYGNPHSQNITGKLTHDTVEQVRYRILTHFHTTPEDYTVIFTAGSTAALRLVAEAFPWVSRAPENDGSHFCYLTDNHTSVVGMRKVAAAMNVTSTPVKPEDMWSAEEKGAGAWDPDCQIPHLFCYPAQSNFSGTRYPLSWIEEVKSGRRSPASVPGKWFVLLDAASYVSTSPLDLSAHRADFVPISFYKIFGLPTGLGALLVHRRVAPLLRKGYFGGGTAAAYLAGEDFYIPRASVAERFEDGTISFLDVIALKHGFDALERLTGGMENIQQQTFALAQYTHSALSSLHYPNGAPVVRIYSDSQFSSPEVQGPIINFNVLDDDGNIIGYSQVDKMASLYNIHLRTGCFCNLGACQRHLGLSEEMVKKNFQAGHVCGDDIDIIDGRPTGSVRISFGYMSTLEDAQAFLRFISAIRLRSPGGQPVPQASTIDTGASLSKSDCHSPQEGSCTDPAVCSDSCLTASMVDLSLSPNEASGIQQTPPEKVASVLNGDRGPHIVTNIYLYPIKSCAAFEVTKWPVRSQGLLYDRSWMIVNHNGVCLSQKQEPRLCLIQPFIDLHQRIMVIKAKGMEPIEVPLEEDSEQTQICQSRVCADRVNTYDCVELYFGEYQHVQQEYGVHLRLASDDASKPRNSQPSKSGSYGVSIRVQGIDGHPYIVLNNAERCVAGTPFPENGPPFPSSVINNLPLHPGNATLLKENNSEELPLPDNPYLQSSPVRKQKPSSLHEGRNGVLERKDGPTKLPHVLNFQRHPELLQPYDPEKSEANSKKHHPPESPWLRNAPEEGTNCKKPRNGFPKPRGSQPNSPTSEDLTKTNVTAIRLCSSVVIEDPQKQTSVCVNVQRCAKDGPGEEALSPRRKSPSPQAYPETKKSRPDVLPFRRQDSAGPVLDGARSRRSSSSSTTPTSATSLYRFLLDDQECAIHADNVNRHENRRYIPFLPGTGRDIDTCSIPGVDQLIEKFDQKPGLQRRGRSGKRNRINPDDRKRSRSVDSAFPFGLQGNTEYLTEFSRNLGKSSEHLLRPSQVFPQKSLAQEHRGKQSPSCTLAKLQGAAQGALPKLPPGSKDERVLGKGSQEGTVACASSLPAQSKKEEEIKVATATLMLQNRAVAATPDSGAKKISVKTFPSDSNTQATPDLLKGQQELTQQTNEETAKQILYNYLKEGGTDNEDATKRKVNLVFEKIQTLKSRAAGSAQGNNQVLNSPSDVNELLDQKNKLILEVSELQQQLQLERKNHQNIKEEREKMREDLEELRGRHQSHVEETATLRQRLEESEGELRRHLEELFQVKMEREQHQTEIRDLQDQLSEMHDELDSTKRSEDREKGALIEELLQAKRDLQDLFIAKDEQEELLRKRERELTALKGALKEEVSSHDQEMEKLKEQYDAELQALRESVEEATKNVEVLASRSSSAEQSQAGADLRERVLKEENEKLQERVAELERRVAQLQRQVEDVKDDEAHTKEMLRKCESEVQQLEEALVHARNEEKEATCAKRALERDLEQAQRELSQTSQEQKELLEKLQAETEQKEQLRKLKNEMESERWHLDKTIEKLQKEMADIAEASRTSSLELQKQLGEYKEKNRRELAEMQTQLKEKSLEAEKARLAASKMQDELRLKEEELRDYQRAEEEALTKRQLLEQSLKDLEYELEAKSHLKDDRSRLLKHMEDKVSQLEIELEEERTNADLLSERITWSREQMEQMRGELLQEKAAKQDLECDKISLERQNKDLKSRIIHLEGSYRSSKEGLVVQMEARIAELEDRLENEERDRANLQLNNRRLERKVKELVMQVDDEHLSLTDQKDQLSLRLKAMKRQVEEAEEEIDRLESAKKKLQRELEEQIGVNEQLQGQLNSMKKGLRLKTLPSKVLDDSDDDDLSSDGGSLYEAPLSYAFPKDSAITSQI